MPGRNRQLGPSWSQVWQMPTLLGGIGLLFVGIYVAVRPAEPHDFPGALAAVQARLEANEADAALEKLREIEAHLGEATNADRARFASLFADQVYLKQLSEHWDSAANHQLVLKYYQQARDLGEKLSKQQLQRWAQTLIALGRETDALAMIDELDSGEEGSRHGLVRQMIERRLDGRGEPVSPAAIAPLLERYKEELRRDGDRAVRRKGSIWVTCLESQLLLDADAPDAALDELMIRYQRLNAEAGADDLAPLLVQLGKAQLRIGNYEEAQRHLLHAMEKLESNDALSAEALVGLAEVEQASVRDSRTALGYYSQTVRDYPDTAAFLRALIGQADCKAKLGSHPEAIDDFALAIERLVATTRSNDPRRELAINIVRSLYELNFDRQEYELALDYLTLLRPLFHTNEGLPANLLLDFAVTHERLAEQRRNFTESLTPAAAPGVGGVSPAGREMANRQAAEHFAAAADFYLAHTLRVNVLNEEQYGMSLWRAAQCYDAAQLWERSVKVYLQYITTRPTDPHYLQAIRRLGMARMASGQYAEAAEKFQELIEQHSRTLEAYASLVPLARCYYNLGRVDDAVRVLEQVVADHESITPESEEYRNALIELGRIYHNRKMFEPAIARLTESVDRFGDTEQGPTLRFLLADSYRQSSEELALALTEVLPENREAALRAARVERLEAALGIYDQVVETLEQRDPASMSAIEVLYHRNAYFYRADCAYDLGRFEQAITLYDQAARRFERDPASLVALVQIVNAYCELGRVQEAQIANDRARWQLKNIPDSAFEDQNLPMNRKHWQNWLRWTNELKLFEPQASAASRVSAAER